MRNDHSCAMVCAACDAYKDKHTVATILAVGVPQGGLPVTSLRDKSHQPSRVDVRLAASRCKGCGYGD